MIEMNSVLNMSDAVVDFDAAVLLMDDEIREEMNQYDWATFQDFFRAYELLHKMKFGEPWELSKPNPTY